MAYSQEQLARDVLAVCSVTEDPGQGLHENELKVSLYVLLGHSWHMLALALLNRPREQLSVIYTKW